MKSTKFRKNGDLPAFNRENTIVDEEGDLQGAVVTLTKREYFALTIMAALIASGKCDRSSVVQVAIEDTDKLLEALEPKT
jgi:hypothetical protein